MLSHVSFGTYLPFNKVSIPKTFPFRRRGLHSIKIKIAQDNTWDMYKITQDRTGIDLDIARDNTGLRCPCVQMSMF